MDNIKILPKKCVVSKYALSLYHAYTEYFAYLVKNCLSNQDALSINVALASLE
jgi:hypothetical protein